MRRLKDHFECFLFWTHFLLTSPVDILESWLRLPSTKPLRGVSMRLRRCNYPQRGLGIGKKWGNNPDWMRMQMLLRIRIVTDANERHGGVRCYSLLVKVGVELVVVVLVIVRVVDDDDDDDDDDDAAAAAGGGGGGGGGDGDVSWCWYCSRGDCGGCECRRVLHNLRKRRPCLSVWRVAGCGKTDRRSVGWARPLPNRSRALPLPCQYLCVPIVPIMTSE